MMNATKISDHIYWVGAIDWNVRNFHGYTTDQGTTYGSYLILDDKITLIDTVKAPFVSELLERISDIVKPEDIDYIVSNHVEMDHSGAIPELMKVAKKAKIVTSSPAGIRGLTMHYGDRYDYVVVKAGDTLSLGKRSLSFVPTPMCHWPDNMVTYCPEEKILFSNDAFGQHFASNEHFDDEIGLEKVITEAKKYYANILMPYGLQIKKALASVKELDINVIATGHGVIWRRYISEILDAYEQWSGEPNPKEAVVVYDSMWHSTETLAIYVNEAFASEGISVRLFDLKVSHMSDIMPFVLTAKYIAVGSPTLNNYMMPTVAGFLCYLKGLTQKNKAAYAFGSYGWSGQSIAQIDHELQACGYKMPCEPFRFLYVPKKEDIKNMIIKIKQSL